MFETFKPEFTGHMVRWDLVHQNMAGITPKNKNSIFVYIGISAGYFLSIKGDNGPVMSIGYYPYKKIPIYL